MMSRGRPKRTTRTLQQNQSLTQSISGCAATPTGTWAQSRILTSKSSAACRPVESYLSLLLVATTGWDEKYDDTERRAIIDALPLKFRHYEVDPDSGRLLCPIDASMVLDNRPLRQAISRVKDEITDGYHEVTWLNQAEKATQQRQAGLFDDYLKQHAEELFGDFSDDQAPHEDQETTSTTSTSDGEWSGKAPTKKPKLRRDRAQLQTTKAATDIEMKDIATD